LVWRYKITVTIEDGIVEGKMPKRALRMIFDWLDAHRDELMENWLKSKRKEALNKIEPLQ